MFERMDQKTVMKWMIVAALVYFVLPYDLFPDFLGFAGRVDDLFVLAWLGWAYRDRIRNYFATRSRQTPPGSSSGTRSGQNGSTGSSRSGGFNQSDQSDQNDPFDPYEILGVSRSASADAIQAAYRARMMEYHPDKVAHLGVALQELAHEKAQQIERAYRALRD